MLRKRWFVVDLLNIVRLIRTVLFIYRIFVLEIMVHGLGLIIIVSVLKGKWNFRRVRR